MPLPRSRNVVPVCVPSGTLTVSLSSSAGHDDLAAERERREVHRDLAEQVVAVAPEELVLLHVDDDVEIARRAAGRAGFAFASSRSRWPVAMPAGILTVSFRSCATRPGAAAGRARLGDDLARPAALAAGARDGEEALLIAELPAPVALRAGRRPRARRRAGAVARLALLGAGNLDRRLGAARRFLERDLEVVAQVGAALRTAAPAPPPKRSPKPKMSPRPPRMSSKPAKTDGSNPPRRRPTRSRRRGRSGRTGCASRRRRGPRRPRPLP